MGFPTWLADVVGYLIAFGFIFLTVGGHKWLPKYLANARAESARHAEEHGYDSGRALDFSGVALPASHSVDAGREETSSNESHGGGGWRQVCNLSLIALTIMGGFRAWGLWPYVGWTALLNLYSIPALLLAVAMIVAYARNGEGTHFWYSAGNLLAHEAKGLYLQAVKASPVHLDRHDAHFEVIRRRAHEAYEHDKAAREAEEHRKLMLRRLAAGRAVLESAMGDVLQYTKVEKVPKKETTVAKDGTKTTRNTWVDQEVAHTRAKVYAELIAPTVALYSLKWVEGYNPQVAAKWESVCADAARHLRYGLGVTEDDAVFDEKHGVLTVILERSEQVEAAPAPEPEVEPEPQAEEIDDESPVVVGCPPLAEIPVPTGTHRAPGRPTEGKTVTSKLVSSLERLIEVQGIKVEDVSVGPTSVAVTVRPPANIKGSTLLKEQRDLAIEMGARDLSMVPSSEFPGCLLIEVPRKTRDVVSMREVLASDTFREFARKALLPVVLGVMPSGKVIVGDLAKFPHELAGGTTGSGKTVALHAQIVSLLATRTPEQVRLLTADPKVVEFTRYSAAPHSLAPCATETPAIVAMIGWLTREMDRRFKLFAKAGVGVNELAVYNSEVSKDKRLPYIIVAVDEIADAMLSGGKDERQQMTDQMARLTGKARAAGIHLVLATQRPTADVFPPLVKANCPARMALMVQTPLDSRIVLDTEGAEKLAGMGDALALLPGSKTPVHVQSPFVAPEGVEALVNWWGKQCEIEYDASLVAAVVSALNSAGLDDEARAYADRASVGLGGQAIDIADRTSPREAEALGGDHLFGLDNEAEVEQASADASDEGQGTKPREDSAPETDDDNGNWFDPD